MIEFSIEFKPFLEQIQKFVAEIFRQFNREYKAKNCNPDMNCNSKMTVNLELRFKTTL